MRLFASSLVIFLALSPLPAQDAWDVTDPGLPLRRVSFTVSEGTWMSSDVNPVTGEIVFDLLGDLYVMGPEGGDAWCLRRGLQWDVQPRWSPDGEMVSFTSDEGGGDNVWVMRRDGTGARPVTKESFRLLNNATWAADGRFLVARKHFTDTRSLGAGEMWLYPLSGGPGLQLTKRKNDQQDAGEPVLSRDGKSLYWSEDVSGGSTFEYNKDPNGQIYVIFAKDLESGEVRREVTGNGGAVRPQLSPDGRSLAFVRRVRTKTVLFLHDLETRENRPLWNGLSRDSQETWSIFGVHPGFSWTPDGRFIVTSAKGRFVKIAVDTGEVQEIPFRAKVEMDLVKTLRHAPELAPDPVRTRVCRWPAVSPDDAEVLFQALGRIWRRELEQSEARPISPEGVFAHTPAWSPDGRTVAYTTWHDVAGGQIRLLSQSDFRQQGDRNRTLVAVPGHYMHPRFSPDGEWIVFERLGGDQLRGRAYTAEPGIYRVKVRGASVAGNKPLKVTERGARPQYDTTGERILCEQNEGADLLLVSLDLQGQDRRVLARSKYATEYEVSPDGRWLAFTELWNAYVCPFPATGGTLEVSKGMSAVPLARLSKDAGQDLSFSSDSSKVHYGLAHHLWSSRLADLFAPPFGIRDLDAPARKPGEGDRAIDLAVEMPADRAAGGVILTNGRIITMEGDTVIEDGAILVRDGRIVGMAPMSSLEQLGGQSGENLTEVDLDGRTVLPGFVDVHAHIRHGSSGILPQRNWQHLANLSFGVTTTHDPSNDTRTTFAAAELQRTGGILAPRLFSTGTILYGADGDFKAVIDSLEDARSHIRRTAAFGAFSVKSYNQPRRDQRQQVLAAARELGVMVVPEGGSTLQHNLTHIVDGHTTLEHALPVAPLYDDVLTMFSMSGTAYTPTLIVGYGGIWGENWFYEKDPVWKNQRLLTWMPRHILDARSRRRTMAPAEEYNHIELATSAAELARRGTIVEVGAHGQIQGLGVHWEMRMFAQGGMPNHDVLRTGTIWAAKALGLDGAVGSLAAGKLADLAIIDGDPLKDITEAENVAMVMINGRLYDARKLEQLWPERRSLSRGPRLDESVPASGASVGCPCGNH